MKVSRAGLSSRYCRCCVVRPQHLTFHRPSTHRVKTKHFLKLKVTSTSIASHSDTFFFIFAMKFSSLAFSSSLISTVCKPLLGILKAWESFEGGFPAFNNGTKSMQHSEKLKINSESTQNQLRINSKSTQNQLRINSESTQNQLRINSESTQNQLRINSESTQNQLRINSKSTQNQLRINSESTQNQLRINSESNQLRINSESTQNQLRINSESTQNQLRINSESTQNQLRINSESTQNQLRINSESTQNQFRINSESTQNHKIYRKSLKKMKLQYYLFNYSLQIDNNSKFGTMGVPLKKVLKGATNVLISLD